MRSIMWIGFVLLLLTRNAWSSATEDVRDLDETEGRPLPTLSDVNKLRLAVRNGALQEAAALLDSWLPLNLPHLRQVFENDAQLATLRTSAEGNKLRERISTLSALWQRALAEGLPVILWKKGIRRAGVFLPGLRRRGVKRRPGAGHAGLCVRWDAVSANKRQTVDAVGGWSPHSGAFGHILTPSREWPACGP